jgi:uroporphyrinogen decarboxylase
MLANITINIWERYQFLRGSENALMDMVLFEPECELLLRKIVEYFHAELDFWLSTGVDGIMFADDWGSQTSLLISPECWRERFKPLYREFFQKVHQAGKFVLFHTDGCIEQVFGDFVELGVDAINSQLFTMNIPELGRKYKGKITFWGEIDRQNVLPGTPEAAEKAVELICQHLYTEQGGLIRQFEAGPGARPDTVLAAVKKWHTLVP